ncbi:MAG TPA: nucleoside phosphorylase [bacterium]|nr:nucleoside phosphorylase [bacterium]
MNEQSPLFEFDPEPGAVLDPSVRFPTGVLPERLVLTFFPKALAAFLERNESTKPWDMKTFALAGHPVHVIQRQGQAVAFFESGVGAPLASGFLEELIALGARKIMVCGGAGVLDKGITQGHLILPDSAIRDEGTSSHYLPPGREVAPDPRALATLEAVLLGRKVPFLRGKTWTTDGLYRETRSKIARRRGEGALCVEMEAAALFSVARFRKAQCAQLLYGGDDVSGETWDHRGWQENWGVQEMMLELCLEAVLGL